MNPLLIAAYTLTSVLGAGVAAQRAALAAFRGGLRPCDIEHCDLPTWIGRVDHVEAVSLPAELIQFDCRNNRLAYLGLLQDDFIEAVAEARDRFGATRVGVFIGTTTSGIGNTEAAYRSRDPASGELTVDPRYRYTHNAFSCADFVRRALRLQGPAHAVLTACSSSAKAFVSAHRAIEADLCDAAVVGGVDSLCLTTLYGFNALQLLSRQPCRPWDKQRDGLSLGEAAGFALLRRADPGEPGHRLIGCGGSLDAHHLTAPHPTGAGAALAMRRALADAGLEPGDVDYIHLHGTGTLANDRAEDSAVVTVFGGTTPCGSSKGWVGHTLGAAGIASAVFACLNLDQGLLPGTLNTSARDPDLSANLLLSNRTGELRRVMSNSFGFGGNNCSLIIGAPA